jgi:hypothetical protein
MEHVRTVLRSTDALAIDPRDSGSSNGLAKKVAETIFHIERNTTGTSRASISAVDERIGLN